MAEEIKVTIGADTSQLRAQLTLAENDLKAFQLEIKRSTNVTDIAKLQNSITILTGKVSTLRSTIATSGTGMDALSTKTKGAGSALIDLSRIAQDAPYGFMAISNNLNPMLESFQRLVKEEGGVANAFKSLGSSLMGPAGIGIALAVVSAAIVYFTSQTSKVKTVIDEAKKANDEFQKSLLSAKSGAMAAGIELQLFVDIARNSKLPLEQRNEALKEANKILGEHGQKLTLDNVVTEAATVLVQKYTAALVAQAVAQAYVKRIADATVSKQDLQAKLVQNAKDQIQLSKELTAAQTAEANEKKSQERSGGGAAYFAVVAQEKYNKGIADGLVITQQIAEAEKIRKDGMIQATLATADATKFMGELGYKVKETTTHVKKLKKELDETDVLKKLNEDMRDQQAISIAFDKSTLPEQMKLVESAITKLISDFNLSPDSDIIMGLKADVTKVPGQLKNLTDYNELLARVSADAYYEEYQKRLAEKLKNPQKDHKMKIVAPKLELTDFGKQLEDQLKSLNDGIRSTFVSLAEDAIAGFGAALGNAMSGKDAFGNFFAGLAKSLGQGMVAIGKMFIKFAAEMLIAKQAIKVNPYLAIAAGIAMVAIGTLLNNAIKAQAFAVGTRNAPGGMALVGERGPELVNIPRGASVIPAAQTSNMMGGMGGAVEVFGVLRGQDIFFSNKKYGLSYGRQT